MVSIISMSVYWNPVVKTLLKLVGSGLFILGLMVAAGLIYSTSHGYMQWWFRSGGYVAVNGVRGGYVHRNRDNSAVIIRRMDVYPNQSYLIWLGDKRHLTHCGEWHAPRFPAFPIGDVNPPCWFFSKSADMSNADDAVSSTLTARPGFAEAKKLRLLGDGQGIVWSTAEIRFHSLRIGPWSVSVMAIFRQRPTSSVTPELS
jgi:hypothetical protein